MKIQLKRSNALVEGAAKTPTAGQMEYGELGVNYNGSDPAIFIKDSNDNIIRIAGSGAIGAGAQPSGDALPGIGEDGDLFFNTSNNKLYVYYGNSWNEVLTTTEGDAKYVNVSGDSMSGDLSVGSNISLDASEGKILATKAGVGTTNPQSTFQVGDGTSSTEMTGVDIKLNAGTSYISHLGTDELKIRDKDGNAYFLADYNAGTTNLTLAAANEVRVNTQGSKRMWIADGGTIKIGGGATEVASINQSGDAVFTTAKSTTATTSSSSSDTLCTKGYVDSSGSLANNGQINVNAGNGITATGTNATADQSANTTRTLSAKSGDSTITVDADGIKVNKGNLGIPTAPNNGTITIVQPGSSNQTFTVNQSDNQTITLKNDNTQPSNGQINFNAGDGLNEAGSNATANQSGNTTKTFSVDAADNTISVTSSGISVNTSNLGIPSAPNNGQINVNAGTGLTASGTNATADQSGNTTRTLSLDTTYTDALYIPQNLSLLPNLN